MRFWKDTKGRQWAVDFTVAEVRRIQKETGIHVAKIMEIEEVAKLKDDELLFCDLLWSVHRLEAERLGLTREDFEGALSGPCIMEACDAVLFGATDFLSDSRKGEVFRQLLTNFNNLQAEKMNQVEKVIELLPQARSIEKSEDVPVS
jgi:hypothetical protein